MSSSDVFRPRLPLDPFAAHHVPWRLTTASLQPAAPQVILILGEPQPKDLLALLTSTYLSRSLLLLATHAPPTLPFLPLTTQGPALRILRLDQPLSVHDAGALRLVFVLEKANNVAGRWTSTTHAKPGAKERIVQLAEDPKTGEFVVGENYVYATTTTAATSTGESATGMARPGLPASTSSGSTPMRYPSPAPSLHASSPLALSSTPGSSRDVSPFASPAHSVSSRTSLALFTSTPTGDSPAKHHRRSRLSSKTSTSSKSQIHLKSTAGSTRAFDAIINFLPSGVQDKALLKHAILVTTLGARYLDLDPSSSSSFSSTSFAPSSFPSSPSLSSRPHSTVSASSSSTAGPSSLSRPVSTSLSPPSKKRFSIFSFGSSVDLSSNAHSTIENEVENDFALLAPRRVKKKASRGSVRSRLSVFLGVGGGDEGGMEGSNMQERWQRMDHAQGQGQQRVAPHIVHVLPHGWSDWSSSSSSTPTNSNLRVRQTTREREREKPKLVQGIEQFLLSFAYPLGGLSSSTSSPSSSNSNSHSSSSVGKASGGHYSTYSSRAREAALNAPRPPPSAFHPSHSFYSSSSHSQSSSASLPRGGMSASAPAISALALAAPTLSPGGAITINGGGQGQGQLAHLQARAVPYIVGPGVFGALVGGSASASSPLSGGSSSSRGVHRRRGSAGSGVSDASNDDEKIPMLTLTHGEAILMGLLDYEPSSGSGGGSGRAWVRGGDVWFEGAQEGGLGSNANLGSTSNLNSQVLSESVLTTQTQTQTAEKTDKGKGKMKDLDTKRPQLPTPPESGSSSGSSSSSRSSSVEGGEPDLTTSPPQERMVFTLTEPMPVGGRFVVPPRPTTAGAGRDVFPRRSDSDGDGERSSREDANVDEHEMPRKPRMIHLSDAHHRHRGGLPLAPMSTAGELRAESLGAGSGEKARSTSALETGSTNIGMNMGTEKGGKEKKGYGLTGAFRKIGFGMWKKAEGAGVRVR